jgi:hypothetical protein
MSSCLLNQTGEKSSAEGLLMFTRSKLLPHLVITLIRTQRHSLLDFTIDNLSDSSFLRSQ